MHRWSGGLFLGFPLGIRGHPVGPGFPIPVIKRGVAALFHPGPPRRLYISASANPGFSGGPVYFAHHETGKTTLTAIIIEALAYEVPVRNAKDEEIGTVLTDSNLSPVQLHRSRARPDQSQADRLRSGEVRMVRGASIKGEFLGGAFANCPLGMLRRPKFSMTLQARSEVTDVMNSTARKICDDGRSTPDYVCARWAYSELLSIEQGHKYQDAGVPERISGRRPVKEFPSMSLIRSSAT